MNDIRNAINNKKFFNYQKAFFEDVKEGDIERV